MRTLLATLVFGTSTIGLGCGGGQVPPEAPDETPVTAVGSTPAEAPPPAADPQVGSGGKITATYEFGAWGPCDRQRIVYTREGDDYSYARICDDNDQMSVEPLTAEQFRQAVFIEDYLAGAGQEFAELPAASHPERCEKCQKCFKSTDEVYTACQDESGVIAFFFSDQARLGRTDANHTRWLISYDEQ